MERRKTMPVSDVVNLFLRQEGLETPYNEYRIINSWPIVMGEMVAKNTGQTYIKGQTLFVQILSPVIKQELLMSHKRLAQRLNEYIGAQVISDVRFI